MSHFPVRKDQKIGGLDSNFSCPGGEKKVGKNGGQLTWSSHFSPCGRSQAGWEFLVGQVKVTVF
jgi:hypothetical protein